MLRLLWEERVSGLGPEGFAPSNRSPMDLAARLTHECSDIAPEICEQMVAKWLAAERTNTSLASSPIYFFKLCEVLLPPEVRLKDGQYFAMRAIRRGHDLKLSSAVAAAAHHFTRKLSGLIAHSRQRSIQYNALKAFIDENQCRSRNASRSQCKDVRRCIISAFRDVCLMLNLLEPAETQGEIVLRPECTDAEYLIGHLFGVPTSIPGFDALFSGGGLMLVDSVPGQAEVATKIDDIGGRAVLCVGPFGSGKTLLSLQFAVEVARKGGVAWVMALEQTEEECLYALESIGISTNDPAFVLVKGGHPDAFSALNHPKPPRGALMFLRPALAKPISVKSQQRVNRSGESRIDYVGFLEMIGERLSWMSNYPLRLLLVDPINVFVQPDSTPGPIRAAARKLFEDAKRAHVNIWFTSEQLSRKPEANRFEENVADTVLHLGTELHLGTGNVTPQQRRYIEVTKSRFQHEFSGQHGLVIESDHGIHIYPSSALVASLMTVWPARNTGESLSFGVPGIEHLLGSESVQPGDLIALAGPGKAKTLLGLQFVLGNADHDKGIVPSVLITDYAGVRIDRLLTTIARANPGKKGPSILERCSLPTGYVEPGRILEEIQAVLERCKKKGARTSRVLITNLSRWEEQMPFLAADATFGVALLALLRNYNATAIVVCGDSIERGSRLRDPVFDQADIFLQFDRKEIKGRATALVSVVTTRLMRHQRETFELSVNPANIEVHPGPLFRFNATGDAKPLRVSLFLHAETTIHRERNDIMLEGLQSTISAHTTIKTQNRRFDPNLLSMSRYSAVDELQVFQIDEFQLPTGPAAIFNPDVLCSFDARLNESLLKERLPELRALVLCGKKKNRFLAVPFYVNLSFFAVHQRRLEDAMNQLDCKEPPQSWYELASTCEKWEASHKEPGDVFFSCPVYEESIETLNCLFFEILWSLKPPSKSDQEDLSIWLSTPEASEAARLFRVLCHKAHRLDLKEKGHRQAIISRHWYNTFNQELSEMPPEDQAQLCIQPLFGGLTTAGEWYLAVPSHSASPEVGLRLIEYLTGPTEETARVDLGVGLPTRAAYYQTKETSNTAISRHFTLSRAVVYELLKNAIRRSNFRHYQRFARNISHRLNQLLEIHDPTEGLGLGNRTLMAEIKSTMSRLASNIHFLTHSSVPGEMEQLQSDHTSRAGKILG